VHELVQGAQGRSLSYIINELNPVLRGWAAYFKLTDTKARLEEFDGWLRRTLRWGHDFRIAQGPGYIAPAIDIKA
jgi:hypothetical protein